MDYQSIIPLFYNKINILHFLVNLLLVILLVLGVLNIWLFLRRKFDICKNESIFFELAISIIAIPFLIFPFHFIFSLLGFYKSFLVTIQIFLVLAGLWGIVINKLHKKIYSEFGKLSFLSMLCVVTVALFVYWPFVMPFAEKFNGHHHILLNMVQQLWIKGHYSIIPPNFVSYDNAIFIWPANLAFFLSLYSFPYLSSVGLHTLFIIPGLLSFLTWRLLKILATKIQLSSSTGDLSFLLIAFSYYNASDFSAIHFDIFSPLLCLLFLIIFIEVFLHKKSTRIPFIILILSFVLLVRKQLFLLFSSILGIILIIKLINYLKKKILLSRIKFSRSLVLLFFIPAMVWCVFVYYNYGSPFFPHDVGVTQMIFKHERPLIKPYLVNSSGDLSPSVYPKVPKIEGSLKDNSSVNFYIENFLPFHLDKGLLVFTKNIFCGLSLSLLIILGFLGFIFLGLYNRFKMSKYLPIIAVVSAGYILTGILFFRTYPKYPHYFAYLISIFSSVFYFKIFEYFFKRKWGVHILGTMIFIVGMTFWGYNLWGHSYKDNKFENIRFLYPYYKTPIDRLSRMTNRDKKGLRREIMELTQAKAYVDSKGGNILYMDHEPGALIPSLLNIENLSQVYYLENIKSQKIYAAKNKEELKKAFREENIEFVYKPGRSHGKFDHTIILKLIEKYTGRYRFVIPVKELFRC